MMDSTNIDNKYGTHDLYLAAYLMVTGVPYVTTIRQGHRAIFYFNVTADAVKANVDSYYTDSDKVPPHAYSLQVRYLKSVIHRV